MNNLNRCSFVVIDKNTNKRRKCKRKVNNIYCFQHSDRIIKNKHNKQYKQNTKNDELKDWTIGTCYFCHDECNPCSQTCGSCARNLTRWTYIDEC